MTIIEAGAETRSLGAEIARKSAWLISQEGADLILAFLFSWIAIRRLGPELFGMLSLVQAVLNLTNLGSYNFEFSLIRLIPIYRGQGHWRSARRLVMVSGMLKTGLALMAAGGLFLAAPTIASIYDQPVLVTALRFGSLSVLAAAVAEVGAAASLGLLHPQVRTLMTTVRRLVELAGLITVIFLGLGLPQVVLVLALADSVAATGYSLAVWRIMRRDPHSAETVKIKELLRRGLAYSTPVMGARVTEIAGREVGKLILGRLAPPAVLGYYAVARLAADRLINILSQSPLASVPVLSQLNGTQTAESSAVRTGILRRLFAYQLVMGNFMAMAIWAAAPFIVRILGGTQFGPTVPVLRTFSLAIVLWAGIATFHGISLVRDRTILILALNLTQMAVAVSAYILLVPRWMATGAALSDDLGMASAFLLGLFLVWRLFGIEPGGFGRRFVQLSVPAWILGIPLLWMPDQLLPLGTWLAGAFLLYTSYLMAIQVFSLEIWAKLESQARASETTHPLIVRVLQAGSRYHRLMINLAALRH